MRDPAGRAAAFYNEWTPEFVERFGPTLQSGLAVPPGIGAEDPHRSAIYLAARAGVREGEHILDAGCGVGGPAIAIASELDVFIEGVTVSEVQVEMGTELIEASGIGDRVRLHLADFHDLPFPDSHFDRVLMFEAICYSNDLDRLVGELARVLKPGGVLYIKDIFVENHETSTQEKRDLDIYHEAWGCTQTPMMTEVAGLMTVHGFEMVSCRRMEEIRTDRFLSRMFQMDDRGLLVRSEFMEHFLKPVQSFPVLWGEVRGSLRGDPDAREPAA